MNKKEILDILNLISDVDGRVVTADMVATWERIFSRYTFAETEKAFYEAAAGLSGRRLLPGDLTVRIQAERNRVTKEDWGSGVNWANSPVCFEHNLVIGRCLPCCRKAAKLAEETDGVSGAEYNRRFFLEVASAREINKR